GKPNDIYEQEADQVAAQVMSIGEFETQEVLKGKATSEEETIQTKISSPSTTTSSLSIGGNIESRLSKGGGSPLPNEVRSFMEPRFGSDLSQVRVHTDMSSMQMNKDLNSQAFTHGKNIYFGAGKSPGNNELTAHELTHVMQQTEVIEIQRKNLSKQVSPTYLQFKCTASHSEANLLQLKTNDTSIQSQQTIPQISPIDRSESPELTITKFSQSSENLETKTIPQTVEQTDDTFNVGSLNQTKEISNPSEKSTLDNNSVSQSKSISGASGGSDKLSIPTDSAIASDPQIDTSSSEGLLASIASTSASSFGQAVNQSKDAATQIQSQEKVDLGLSLPEIERPTGLPSIIERENPDPTVLPSDRPLELINASGRDGSPPEVKHEEPSTPVPGSQVSTAVSAPPPDNDEGSWWDWLVNRVNNFLGSISTHDTGLSTSAGSRPNIDMSGDADPSQNVLNQQQSEQEVSTRNGEADLAVVAQFGEDEIYPVLPAEKLKSTYELTAPTGMKGSNGANPPNLPDDMRADFDQHETPKLSIEVNEQAEQYRQQQSKYQQESQETRKQGQQQIAQENEQTCIEQQSIQQQAKSDVDAERQRWQEENHKIRDEYANQSKEKQQEIDQRIQEKVQSTDQETDRKLTEAEQKAETERQNTERQAADKKREVENKPRSFWDDVKDTISSVFDSLRETINGLFEGLRKLVKGIIEAAKTAVRALIEAARTVIVELIKGFGEFLKGLVNVALAAFPETAAKARAWIDKRVDAAMNAVNAAADKLKQATNAILNWVGETLDKALSVVQGAFNLILDVLEFLAKAPFEIMNLLAKLADILKQFGSFIDGLEELLNNLEAIEAAAKETLQVFIDQIPEKTHEVIQTAIQQVGEPTTDSSPPSIQLKQEVGSAKKPPSSLQKHLEGIWRHLKPGLQHIKANWWDEIKKMVWDLVWPFNDKSPIWKDVPEMIHLPGKIFSSLWDGKFSQAVDQFLQFSQKINSIVGVFYGWFFIASVLVGTVIGAFFGGAGAIPGAVAGAAFAGEVGEILLIAMVGTETAIIGKAIFDLAFGSGTEQANDNAYDRIASSGLTLGIIGVFVALSAIAGKIASELVSGIKGLFKGEVPEAPSIKVDAPEVKGDKPEVKPDVPETKGDTPEVKDLGTEGGKKVLAEEPTPDGHKVKVTEEGECLICSDCVKMRQEYAQELADPVNKDLKAEFEAADAIDGKANPEAKAKAEADIRQKLEA
ncbi:MAG: eCIS core domain-containing protein, partial [Chroococcidiopsis sp.]